MRPQHVALAAEEVGLVIFHDLFVVVEAMELVLHEQDHNALLRTLAHAASRAAVMDAGQARVS